MHKNIIEVTNEELNLLLVGLEELMGMMASEGMQNQEYEAHQLYERLCEAYVPEEA
jgi:hypothetical protein